MHWFVCHDSFTGVGIADAIGTGIGRDVEKDCLNHSYSCHDSFICVPWRIFNVCCDSFICVPWLNYRYGLVLGAMWRKILWCVHMCAVTHPFMSHDSFICVSWRIHLCVMTHIWMTHSFVCHDSITGVGIADAICTDIGGMSKKILWCIYMCAVTHLFVCRDLFICVPWRIHTCAMTHSCVWHDSITGMGIADAICTGIGRDVEKDLVYSREGQVRMSHVTCVLQCVAVCCSVLQCVAVCCSAFQSCLRQGGSGVQCVAVCCSVFQSYLRQGGSGVHKSRHYIHVWMSHETCVDESWDVCGWVIGRVWMSHGACISHGTLMNESCHAYGRVVFLSHLWMSRDTHMNELSCLSMGRKG